MTVKGQGLPLVRVTFNDWNVIVDTVRAHSGNSNIPEWVALTNYYNVCLPSLITETSLRLWRLYCRINGTKNETYNSYYGLPAFWVDACDIIEAEINRIDKAKAESANREQHNILREINKHGK